MNWQDGEVSVDEFKKGIESSCKGKEYNDFPQAFKFFIDSSFRTIDINGKIQSKEEGTLTKENQVLGALTIGNILVQDTC